MADAQDLKSVNLRPNLSVEKSIKLVKEISLVTPFNERRKNKMAVFGHILPTFSRASTPTGQSGHASGPQKFLENRTVFAARCPRGDDQTVAFAITHPIALVGGRGVSQLQEIGRAPLRFKDWCKI